MHDRSDRQVADDIASNDNVWCKPDRPTASENGPAEGVVLEGPGKVGGFRDLLDADDIAFIRQATEPTLRRLELIRYISDGGEAD